MSKTTPVRWWRDDATRYQKRGPHDEQWGGPGKWGNGYAADIAVETEWQETQHGRPWLRIAALLGTGATPMTVAERISRGELPRVLEGADWKLYATRHYVATTWGGFCEAWRDIAWVRLQAFERDAEAEWAAEEYEASTAAGGSY